MRVHLFVIGGHFPTMIDALAIYSEKARNVIAKRMPKGYDFIPSLLRNSPSFTRTTTGGGRTNVDVFASSLAL
jgi:hypothetical protein